MRNFTTFHLSRNRLLLACLLLCATGEVMAGPVPRNECANPPPGTVFCEDFEGVNPKANFSDFDGNLDTENLVVADVGPAADLANKAIRLRAPAGQRGNSDLVKVLPGSYDKLFVRWYLKFEPGFNFGALNHGGGLAAGDRNFLGVSGNRPNGNDFAGFYVQYEEGTAKPYAYSYYRGMYQDCGSPGNCYGDSFPCVYDAGANYCTKPQHRPVAPLPLFAAGQWYCVEQMVDMGTPSATAAGANGRLVFWLNGQVLGDFSDLWIRTTAALKVQSLWLNLFHHDGTHSIEGQLIDNVVVSTQRVGCGAGNVQSAVSLSVSSQTFAGQNIGTTSVAQSVTLTNTGGAVLNISSIVANGDFARTTTCGATLAQGANCTISVTFAPSAAGTRSGSVVITSDAVSSPDTITLSGIGVGAPLVLLNPTALSFAGQNVGTISAVKQITLTNSGSAGLNLTSIGASGDFSVSNNCGVSLGSGGSCNLSVTFTPTSAGVRTGAITITSNASGSPHTVSLGGAAIGPPSAPTGVSGIPGNTQARINFGPPTDDGGSPVTGYSVRCNAGLVSVSSQSSPVVLTGLTNDTLYSCMVTATNAIGESPPSLSVNITPSASTPVFLVAAQSRKVHGATGTFDLAIDITTSITGNVTVEPRTIGSGHTIVFQFSGPVVAPGTVSVTPVGAATLSSLGNEVLVTLTGIPDNRRVTVSLSNVNGVVSADPVSIGFLVGDSNTTRSVNSSDISGVKARSGQTTNALNFKFDVNATGSINSSDISAVKARSGLVLP